MRKLLKIKLLLAVIFFSTIFIKQSIASQLLDDFSSIYHSDMIIEVAVVLDEKNHPTESYFVKIIKGSKKDLPEVLQFFGISKKRAGAKASQKRLMFFYKNCRGQRRCMNLIREGVGPYSDEATYKSFVSMVKLVNSWLSKHGSGEKGMIVIRAKSVCKKLLKNKYFLQRHRAEIEGKSFSVGGEGGIFTKFNPLVSVKCD